MERTPFPTSPVLRQERPCSSWAAQSLATAVNLDNAGTISLSPGSLNVTGNYTQAASGALDIGVGGLHPVSQFGQLNVSGQVALNGALNLSLLNSYSPQGGNSYRILTFGSRTGDFAAETGLSLGPEAAFSPTYDATGLDLNVIAEQGASDTAVTSSLNPSVYGQSVTFTATVSAAPPATGTPTGTVTFYDGTTAIDTATLSNGSASYTTSALAVGGQSISVQYSGDTNFTGSTSATLVQVVNQDGSAAAVTSSLNPAVYGQGVKFTATVTAAAPGSGTPTGQVTFYDGATAIDSATLNNGSASYTTSALAVGGQSITVQYQGDSNFTPSTSAAVAQTVNQDGSTTTISSSANPASLGQSVTFTTTVSAAAPGGGTPTGSVTFYDGTTAIDTATLSGGSATFTTTSLTVGSHAISISYGGDTNFAGSNSATLTETIRQSSATAAVTSSANPTVYGQSVTFTATVTAVTAGTGTPTGQVTFYDGATAIDTATLSDGTASYTTSALTVGGHSITVQYGGDANFTGNTSTAITQTIDQDSSTTTITSSLNPSAFGESVTLTATVAAVSPGSGTPAGQVIFYDGTTAIDTATLNGGTASYTTSALAVGGHSITADYGGNADFAASGSPPLDQTVQTSAPATLNGEVYNDPTGSGAIASGAGLANWTVDLLSGSTLVASTTTDSDGDFTFADVNPARTRSPLSRCPGCPDRPFDRHSFRDGVVGPDRRPG